MAQLLIHENKIIQVETKTFPVHKSLQWVDGTGAVGDSYIDGAVVPYIEPVIVRTWKDSRREQYAEAFSVSDQIDIIQKQFESMISRGEVMVVPEAQAWLDKIEQIKTDNPKPTE